MSKIDEFSIRMTNKDSERGKEERTNASLFCILYYVFSVTLLEIGGSHISEQKNEARISPGAALSVCECMWHPAV